MDRLAREAEEQSQQKHNLEVDLKRASEPFKVLSRRHREAKKEIASAERSLEAAKRQLEAKRSEILARAGSAESEAIERTKKLQDAEVRLANAKDERDQIRQAVNDSRKTYDELEPQLDQARNEVRAGEKRLRALSSQIRELEASGNSSMNIFGQRCGAVHGMVCTCVICSYLHLVAPKAIASSGSESKISRPRAGSSWCLCEDCSRERDVWLLSGACNWIWHVGSFHRHK